MKVPSAQENMKQTKVLLFPQIKSRTDVVVVISPPSSLKSVPVTSRDRRLGCGSHNFRADGPSVFTNKCPADGGVEGVSHPRCSVATGSGDRREPGDTPEQANVTSVCLSLRLSVCLSVCLSFVSADYRLIFKDANPVMTETLHRGGEQRKPAWIS